MPLSYGSTPTVSSYTRPFRYDCTLVALLYTQPYRTIQLNSTDAIVLFRNDRSCLPPTTYKRFNNQIWKIFFLKSVICHQWWNKIITQWKKWNTKKVNIGSTLKSKSVIGLCVDYHTYFKKNLCTFWQLHIGYIRLRRLLRLWSYRMFFHFQCYDEQRVRESIFIGLLNNWA